MKWASSPILDEDFLGGDLDLLKERFALGGMAAFRYHRRTGSICSA